MPNLTTINVTCNPDSDVVDFHRRVKEVLAVLSFGNGVLLYPANGIPMPAPGAFYMNFLVPYRFVDIQQPVNGYYYTYDPTVRSGAPYGTLRIIVAGTGVEMGNVAVPATTLTVKVLGD